MLCCSILSNAVGIWYYFRSSHVLALLCITIECAQQPAALIRQTLDIVMVPLFALQIDQTCKVPILCVTILGPPPPPTMVLWQFSLRYTQVLIPLTLC